MILLFCLFCCWSSLVTRPLKIFRIFRFSWRNQILQLWEFFVFFVQWCNKTVIGIFLLVGLELTFCCLKTNSCNLQEFVRGYFFLLSLFFPTTAQKFNGPLRVNFATQNGIFAAVVGLISRFCPTSQEKKEWKNRLWSILRLRISIHWFATLIGLLSWFWQSSQKKC